MNQNNERPSFSLPVKMQADVSPIVLKTAAKLYADIKRQMQLVVNDRPIDFDRKFIQSLENLYQSGFNNGLKTMDRLHKKVDNG
jgi:hypothetical protein